MMRNFCWTLHMLHANLHLVKKIYGIHINQLFVKLVKRKLIWITNKNNNGFYQQYLMFTLHYRAWKRRHNNIFGEQKPHQKKKKNKKVIHWNEKTKIQTRNQNLGFTSLALKRYTSWPKNSSFVDVTNLNFLICG